MSDWVPLVQTLAWIALISVILIVGRAKWGGILQAVEGRISQGDDMTLSGPLGLSAELRRETKGLPRLEPTDPDEPSAARPGDDLTALRQQMGADQRGVHLVHVVAPTEGSDRNFDVFTYLYGWKRKRFNLPEDMSDISRAEFFLGPLFSPDRVTVANTGGTRIGFATTIHAPALCLCKITFKDGQEAVVSRYLDLESGDMRMSAPAPRT